MTHSSTADLPPLELHRKRRSEIAWFLRSTIKAEEAEALAGQGYRSLPCGGCGRLSCDACNREPADQVRGSSGTPQGDARHVRAIVARLGHFPAIVVTRTYPSLRKLPPLERLVLMLHDGAGLDQLAVSRQLKVSRSTVQRARDRALDALTTMVYDSPN